MVDLQKTGRRRDGTSPVLILMLTLLIAVLLGGGYFGYRLIRYWTTFNTAEQAKSVAGMAALTRKQVMARISVSEPGASLFDWTETGTSASGLSCSVMNRGDMQTGWAWTVCGVGERVVRVSVGARQGVISANSSLPPTLMRRMIAAVAPEAPAEHRFEAGDAFNYYWGNHGGVNIGGAAIRFSTDNDGGLTRITATPRV